MDRPNPAVYLIAAIVAALDLPSVKAEIAHLRMARPVLNAARRMVAAEREAVNHRYPPEQWGPWISARNRLRKSVLAFERRTGANR